MLLHKKAHIVQQASLEVNATLSPTGTVIDVQRFERGEKQVLLSSNLAEATIQQI